MKISEWRPALDSWLTSKMLVASRNLRNPDVYGRWFLFLPALESISYEYLGNRAQGVAIQEVYLTIRYPYDTAYVDLPINRIEAIYNDLSRRLLANYIDIAPLLSLDVLAAPNPISIQEYGDGDADWLVTIKLTLGIRWDADLEYALPSDLGDPVIPQPLRVELGLYKAKLVDIQQNKLDHKIVIDAPNL